MLTNRSQIGFAFGGANLNHFILRLVKKNI